MTPGLFLFVFAIAEMIAVGEFILRKCGKEMDFSALSVQEMMMIRGRYAFVFLCITVSVVM